MTSKIIIDYYFAPMSGYAYLGHAHFLELAVKSVATVNFHPLDMAQVFAAAGSFPPAKYPEIRQHHRKADMLRWAAQRSLPINATPAYWPVPMGLACQVITAAKSIGADQGVVTGAILAAVWAHDLNIADIGDIATILDKNNLPTDKILTAAKAPNVIAAAQAETQDAIAKGLFGSPTYVVSDEWFFGQDRLDFLERALWHR